MERLHKMTSSSMFYWLAHKQKVGFSKSGFQTEMHQFLNDENKTLCTTPAGEANTIIPGAVDDNEKTNIQENLL